MKVLITGADGQLGKACTDVLGNAHRVIPTNRGVLDISDKNAVEAALARYRPEVVINCAAFTRVDDCEEASETAFRINSKGPEYLAVGADKYGCKLIHISTDYVFGGAQPISRPFVEEDPPEPLSVYGQSKLAGERAIQLTATSYAIVRSAWIFGVHGKNFLKTILRIASNRSTGVIKIVNDQFGCPTWSRTLARQIKALVERGGNGIYHAAGEGACTWYELAEYFLNRMGVAHRVLPCRTEDFPTAAVRPPYSVLENRRLKLEGIHVMKPWRQDVDDFVRANKERLLEDVLHEGLSNLSKKSH